MTSSRPRQPRRAAASLLLFLALSLAACQGAEVAENDAEVATESPPPAAQTNGPLVANVSDGCVDTYSEGVDYFPQKSAFVDATGVSVTYAENYKVVEVVPPYAEGAEPVRTVLVQCGTPAPPLTGDLAGAQIIEVPVREIVSLTTTNLPHFDAVGAADRIVGVGTGAFVSTPSIAERVAAGEVPDFADDMGTPDLERLVEADPDLLIIDGFGDTVLDDVQRFIDSGVPTVVNADFNEGRLLGRAEWLKFSALFVNAEGAANATFDAISREYRRLAALAAGAEERPSVFANTPYEGNWFVPGGQSFFSEAIAAAAGHYVFGTDPNTGAIQVDVETMLDKAQHADLWLQAGSVSGTLDDLLAIDERFSEFMAFRRGQVWALDKAVTPGGGNAIYETAYTRADLYLADLVKILHPDLLPDHELVFFGQVPSGSP